MRSSKESREMYLEVILQLEKSNGVVRSIDIAKELNYTRPSVSRAVRILADAGYVTHTPYGDVFLTNEGRKRASKIYHTHQVMTDFFVQILGLDRETAEQDACRMEHVISDRALSAMEGHLRRFKRSTQSR